MAQNQTIGRAYLRELIDTSFDRAELAATVGVSEGRFTMLLSGRGEFRYSEMLALAKALVLDSKAFDRCFFTSESSENLN